ncbi:hypothetical protein Gorai_020967 [Gossypium raimondii]|uniref:RNase H type-1 domain-containing protein n=1 Tax=Gossypium raimondii TaxID=29730 RepID=A0A7J8NP88_GOSRA|nr:hypothetical protein [Gossypium raimondii]
MGALLITYLAVWHAQNRLVHDGIKLYIQELVVFIKGYILELEAFEELKPCTIVPKQEILVPPDHNNIKFHYDASFIANANTSISGVLARNDLGEIMVELRFRSIQVESDSLTVVKAINSTSFDKLILGPIVQVVQKMIGNFENFTFGFVGGSVNSAAHILAGTGRHLQAPQFWIEEAP